MSDGRTYINAVAQLAVGDDSLTLVAAPTVSAGTPLFQPALRIHRIVYHPNLQSAYVGFPAQGYRVDAWWYSLSGGDSANLHSLSRRECW